MNLTTKGRYAVTAMVDLALYSNKKPVCLADIAQRQNIALSYLEQIFMRLRKAGLVKSVRGPGGGYVLAVSPDEMPIARIVIAVDESIKMTRCGGSEPACTQSKGKCMTHNLWEGLSNRIHDYLNSVSLADVCNKNNNFKETGANVAHLS
ncbi:MAG: Rrf2 family transcriptional regulator [Rickettsiaceae bacterium]|jgi:Rrf2 family iron-sulfur cluster assembly transcriptional regulator|nr:Rrf2 family transcriptional regulator [Rickettsiaceae bacterium]